MSVGEFQSDLPDGLRDPIPFPSKVNYMDAKLNIDALTFAPTVVPKLIEPSYKSAASNVPLLDKDGIEPKLVIPAPTKIQSKPNLGEGYGELARSQEAWNDIQALISANTLLSNNRLSGLNEVFKNTKMGDMLKINNPNKPNQPGVPPYDPSKDPGAAPPGGSIINPPPPPPSAPPGNNTYPSRSSASPGYIDIFQGARSAASSAASSVVQGVSNVAQAIGQALAPQPQTQGVSNVAQAIGQALVPQPSEADMEEKKSQENNEVDIVVKYKQSIDEKLKDIESTIHEILSTYIANTDDVKALDKKDLDAILKVKDYIKTETSKLKDQEKQFQSSKAKGLSKELLIYFTTKINRIMGYKNSWEDLDISRQSELKDVDELETKLKNYLKSVSVNPANPARGRSKSRSQSSAASSRSRSRSQTPVQEPAATGSRSRSQSRPPAAQQEQAPPATTARRQTRLATGAIIPVDTTVEKRDGNSSIKTSKGLGIGKISGFIPFGKFEIDKKKLVRDHLLSLRYSNSGKKVNGIPNSRVSEQFVSNIMSLINQEPVKESMSGEESRLFHYVIMKSDADIPKIRSLKLDQDPMSLKQLYTMLAEIDAGNNSIKMLRNIKILVDHLYREGHISKQLSSQIQNAYFK